MEFPLIRISRALNTGLFFKFYLISFSYLGLEDDIGIFWTGSMVVSEEITKEEILELSAVIRRKPVLWDNLHANDYDQQRMFLGKVCRRPRC